MAQTGYTPISLYYSTTASQAPTAGNLANGELAINITDGKLYYKDNAGAVQVLATKAAAQTTFQTSLGGLTPQTATSGAVTLAGTLNTTSGGTGLTSFTAGDLPYYASGTALSKLGIGTNGQILTSTGTAPQWTTLSGVAVTTFSAGTTGFTPSSATSGAITLAGTLNVANGGTGLTSLTAGYIPFGAGTSAFGNSANLFWDSANSRLGVGTTTPSRRLEVAAGTGGPALRLTNTNSNSGIEILTAPTTYSWLLGAQNNVGSGFEITPSTAVGGTTFTTPTAVFLQNGSVGIGTTGPGRRLSVSNAGAQGIEFGPGVGGGSGNEILNYNRVTSQYVPCQTYASTLAFYSGTAGGSLGLYQDGSGLVGIGTLSPSNTLSVSGTVGAGSSSLTDAIYQRNQAVSGTYFTILHSGTGLTGVYPDTVTDATKGAHITMSSGDLTNDYAGVVMINAYGKAGSTLGNYISFGRRTGVDTISESARFNSIGYFGIGNNNPQYYLDVNVSARIRGSTATFYMDSTYSTGQSYRWIVPDNTYGAPFGSLALYSDTQGAYRLVMTSAGNLGIGITAPSARLHVYQDSSSTSVMSGAYIQNVSSTTNSQAGIGFFAYDNYNAKIYTLRTGSSDGNLVFATNNGSGVSEGFVTEKARIDKSGALLINFTANPYQNENTRLAIQGGETPLWVQGTQQGYCQGSIAIASGTADSPGGRGLGTYLWNRGTTATWFMGTAYSAANSWFVMRQTGANFRADTADVGLGWLMQLTSSGVAYQGNNSSTWTTTSDARIKDDVQTIENGLDIVLALRPVEFYNKITKKREENFIAQEYERVLAKHITREEPVGAEKEFVTDEILRLNPNLVPYLISAIQKLNAEIEALKATRN